jgi:hypothetical protein
MIPAGSRSKTRLSFRPGLGILGNYVVPTIRSLNLYMFCAYSLSLISASASQACSYHSLSAHSWFSKSPAFVYSLMLCLYATLLSLLGDSFVHSRFAIFLVLYLMAGCDTPDCSLLYLTSHCWLRSHLSRVRSSIHTMYQFICALSVRDGPRAIYLTI